MASSSFGAGSFPRIRQNRIGRARPIHKAAYCMYSRFLRQQVRPVSHGPAPTGYPAASRAQSEAEVAVTPTSHLNLGQWASEEKNLAEDRMTSKINVLLVDDSRTVLAQLERILGDIDDIAIVGVARNGAAAIRMADESRPDLILMDIVMPGLDGLSALRTIKSMHPEIRIAMVSSISGDATKAEQAFKLGACQVLGKPFDLHLIESLVENVRGECGQSVAELN